jgi:integrase
VEDAPVDEADPSNALPSRKPAKPFADFPLTAHASGLWSKKIRGRTVYFGPWADPDKALDKYLKERDDLQAGRRPRAVANALRVKDAANAFLAEKRSKVDAGELAERTWAGYNETCVLLVTALGKRRLVVDLGPSDFASLRRRMAARWGPVRLVNVIQTVRSVFKFAYEADLIERPVRFGPAFKKPSAKVLRLHRAAKGVMLFTPAEIHSLLAQAVQPLRAMILLGVNCGLGNADCAKLTFAHIDLERGWLNYPRPKTGVPRRCKLWPETVASIREALATRPKPASAADAGLVFISRKRGGVYPSFVSHLFVTLTKRVGVNGHRGFYTLRHTFRTEADASRDQPAIDHIMGHAKSDMASLYRERIDDERLVAVANHVRTWLYGAETKEKPATGDAAGDSPHMHDTPPA